PRGFPWHSPTLLPNILPIIIPWIAVVKCGWMWTVRRQYSWFNAGVSDNHGSAWMGRWRRERDSNPRYGYPYTRSPGVRLQPLGHPSMPPCHTATGGGDYSTAAARATRRRRLYAAIGVTAA